MLAWCRPVLAPVAMLVCLVAGWPVAAIAPQTGFERPDPPRPGRPPATATPFRFHTEPGAPTARRRPASSGRYLDEWLKAVDAHQPGEADAAVRLVSAWSGDQLSDTIVGFETRPPALFSQFIVTDLQKAAVLKRAVLLHTDIALLGVSETRAPDSVARYDTASLHFGVALDLIEWFRRQADRNGAFAHDWYRMLAAFLVAQYEIRSAPTFMEWAVDRFRDDAEMLLLAGGVHEYLASSRVQDGPEVRDVEKCGTADDNLDAAEYFYRQALRRRSSMAEARVRLGRVLGQRGHHNEALAELKRALAEAPPAPLVYYLHLFIGQEEEAERHPDAARAAYERAIALRPDAAFAYLALSRLDRNAANRQDAVEAVQKMLRSTDDADRSADLWAEYYAAGEARRASALVAAFREPFRRHQ